MEEFKQSSIKVIDIILAESNFERSKEPFDSASLKNNLNIDIKIEELTNQFYVTLTLKYEGLVNENVAMKSLISMVGIFELIGEKPEYYEEFKKVNAPAIIYPFVREHLHSLTNKSGYEGINLPPFNFVAYSQKYFKEQKEELANLVSDKKIKS
jgi:preprotein translocase subunit SecB